LDNGLKAEIDEHLKSCPSCSEELKELSSLSSLFEKLPKVSPSLDFEQKLWERINATVYPAERKERQKKTVFVWGKLRWGYAISFAVIILVAFVLVKSNFKSLKESKPAVFEPSLSWQEIPIREKIDYETILPKAYLKPKGIKKYEKENPVFVIDNLKLGREYQNLLSQFNQRRVRTYPVSSPGNYYVMPVVSSQQVVQKVSY
jgi:hypothetical protein